MKKPSIWRFKNNQQLILFFLVITISILASVFLLPLVEKSYFIKVFALFTGKVVVAISSIIGFSVQFDSAIGKVQFLEKYQSLVLPVGAYSYYFLILYLFFLVPLKNYLSIIGLCIFTFLFLAFRAASITSIFLLNNGKVHGVLPLFLDPLVYIPMFFSLLFIIKNNEILYIQYKKIESLFVPIIHVPLHKVVLFLILIPPLPRVFLTYLNVDILNFIVSFTLKGSQIILHQLGYIATISTKFLILNRYSIQLEYPCLGLSVITIIYIFVFVIRANWLNKLVFLALFTAFFSLMNSFRLAMALVYLQNISKTAQIDKTTIHDIITYFMYLVAFASLLLFHFWFQDLNLKKIFKPKM